MWLIIITTVDNGTHGVDLLDHSTGKSLSECRTCKFCLTHSLCGMDYTGAFIRKVNTCPAAKIKECLCFQELLCSHFSCNLHHAIVAGIGDYITKCLCPMGIRPYRTLNVSVSVGTESLTTVTDKSIIYGNTSLFQGACHNDRFYNRTGLKSICNTEVTPHTIERLYGLFIIHGINLCLRINLGKIPGIIQIITVSTIHGKDLTCGRFHYNNTDVFGSHFGLESIYVFLNDLLCTYIKRSNNTFSVGRLDNGLFHIGIVIDVSILTSVCTGKSTVVVTFQTYICCISCQRKSYGITGKIIKRITSQIIFFKPYTLYITSLFFLLIRQIAVFGNCRIFIKFLLVIHGQLFLDDLILAVFGLFGAKSGADIIFIQPQYFCQCPYRRFYIISLFRVNCLTVQDHIVYLVAGCQYIPIPVINISSFGRKDIALILLLSLSQHLFFVFVSADSIDISDPAQQTN